MSQSHRNRRKKRKAEGDKTYSIGNFAAERQMRRDMAVATGDLRHLAQSAEDYHYHIMYNAIPNMLEGFETATMAYRAVAVICEKHTDAKGGGDQWVNYYEEGIAQLNEVTFKHRPGKTFDVMLQVGACQNKCTNIRRLASITELVIPGK